MMKLRLTLIGCLTVHLLFAQHQKSALPQLLLGRFTDDYQINYTISDSVWLQQSHIKYHILKVDTVQQYILLKNDANNKFDANRYTRIDYMYFTGMKPYEWGFCLTSYKAKDAQEAEAMTTADRKNPKKGCNGYPFSRMAKTEK